MEVFVTIDVFKDFILIASVSFCLGSIIGPMTKMDNQQTKCCKTSSVLCRHNDSNTDIYLRRILEKLDKIIEQTKPPLDNLFYAYEYKEKIEKDAEIAKIVIEEIFEQLRLIKEGGIQTGYLAKYLPDFLTNNASKCFDYFIEYTVCQLTEKLNYTREEAEKLRNELPCRDDLDKEKAKRMIWRYTPALIRNESIDKIFQENNYEIYARERIGIKLNCISCGISSIIVKAIWQDEVTSLEELQDLIRKNIANKL